MMASDLPPTVLVVLSDWGKASMQSDAVHPYLMVDMEDRDYRGEASKKETLGATETICLYNPPCSRWLQP